MKSIVVTKNEDGIKLTKFLKNVFRNMPDSLLHKLLRKKYFKINDKKADGSEILKTNDTIYVYFADETFDKFYTGADKKTEISNINVDTDKYLYDRIVYEDENVIIYNKPIGLLSQSSSRGDISANDILCNYVVKRDKDSLSSGVYNFRPSIMNRLDRNTEGLIIFAKTYLASRLISEMIRDGNIEKHYKTIVNGVIDVDNDELINLYKKDEEINKAIIKEYKNSFDDGEYLIVKLKYKVLKRFKDSTLLDIDLLTGKSHQIRAQLSYIGHPIICDKKYMDNNLYDENVKKYSLKHQKLICYYIKFGVIENENLDYLSNKVFKIETNF